MGLRVHQWVLNNTQCFDYWFVFRTGTRTSTSTVQVKLLAQERPVEFPLVVASLKMMKSSKTSNVDMMSENTTM